MSTETMTPNAVDQRARRPDIHLEIFIWGAAAVLSLAFGVVCRYYAKTSDDREWLYVASILGLPLLQVPIVILMLRKNSEFWAKGALVLLPSLFLEILLWFAFTFRDLCKGVLSVGSTVGLGSALVLGAIVFWVTGLIMDMANGRGRRFRTLLREQPFLVVCFFMTIFTFSVLFLSLSLALHDQDLRINKSRLGVYSKSVEPLSRSNEENSQAKSDKLSLPLKLYFAQGSAAVDLVSTNEDSEDGVAGEDQPASDPELTRKRVNAVNLDSLTGQIIGLAEKDHVRVVLAGHSDDQPLDKANTYKSNLELSQARIHQVIVNLIKRLDSQPKQEWRRNIEWMILPCANEQGFLDGKERRRQSDRLSVEVLLLPSDQDRFASALQLDGKGLDLLDYIYFGVYTITTTGNGDIVPVSSYAKFITTVTNFFAVFLMAVFFNVLISFLREGGELAKITPAAGH
jgi:hypothetical protein